MKRVRELALVLIAACALPHVEPRARSEWAEGFMLARVNSSCSEPYPFNDNDPTHDGFARNLPDTVWRDPLVATGVIISERHILTAAHVDRCPVIPSVVVFAAGREFRVEVERNDSMFGSGADIARLEIASAEHFGLGIPPPRLGVPVQGESLCYFTLHGRLCGLALNVDYAKRTVDVDVGVDPGDSGAPLCDAAGDLIGIATWGNSVHERAELVGQRWLEGT